MKIRNSFVSNSSSSSFIVSVKDAVTVGECAFIMLSHVIEQRKERYPEDEIVPVILAAQQWLQDNLTYDKPIVIPWTCNYETWVWKNDVGICVDTCNNEGWYDILDAQYVSEDWPYIEEEGPQFKDGHSTASFLDLSTMKETTKADFVELYLRKVK